MRENLVRMLRCIGHLQTFRGTRKTVLVPGSAMFHSSGGAELTFYHDDPASAQGDGQCEDEEEAEAWELPEVAHPFVISLVYAALWLDRSDRLGEEVEIKGPRVLCPGTIYDMLREKQYLTWSVQDATEFAMQVPFVPLEKGGWYDTELVSEWKDCVQRFRAHEFLAGLVIVGAVETWSLVSHLDHPSLLEAKTVTYDCLMSQDVRRGSLNVVGWPSVLETIEPRSDAWE